MTCAKREESLERSFLVRTDIMSTVSLVASHLCRENEILVPKSLQALPLFISSEKLVSEEHKEIVHENSYYHRCLYRVELLHGEAAEDEIFFQFFDGVLAVGPRLGEDLHIVLQFSRIGYPDPVLVVVDGDLMGDERQGLPHGFPPPGDILPNHDVPPLLFMLGE